jgi:predicted TIM-barrel fold metal-dependent hydrolase
VFEEFAPRELMNSIGEDNILFETDYPHPVCLYGNVREKIDRALGDATPEARHKVLWGNSAKLYKIEPPDVPPPLPVG